MAQVTFFDRITMNTGVMEGKATIRDTNFLAATILLLMAEGNSKQEILQQHPFLVEEDITATLKFAVKLLKNK
ncbi:hypothetical protein CAP35_10950 [Chitinophagaceae bacterium IBVUCB1]|nr:hypothetical protein CAP35_10950 [Chitinophagaceae bacterium IBVUCB1]